ncbi:MAG: response regulator transcription factor [Proteobacteria bacterium]|nr:response regulator transcription factor [Pseudomonadota bacterium]MBI3496932.1 response regulator transcription factor [Pseudomonadota bacterium]
MAWGAAVASVEPEMARPVVYVVDDDPSIRRLFAWLLGREGVRVVGCDGGESFLEAFEADGPVCLVLDLTLGGMDGLALQQRLKDRGVELPIVFISGTAEIAQAVAAVKHGAVDFVVKPFDYRHLVELVRTCLKSSADSWARRRRGEGVSSQLAALTPREREVMERVVAGKPNRVIADELAVSVKTIEWHRARIMEKLQVHSLAELIRLSLTG